MPDFGSIFKFVGEGVLPIFLLVVVLGLVIAYLGSRFKVAGANEALIISGRREAGAGGQVGLKVVRGQGVIVLPLVHKLGRLHLSARQINVQLSDAVTKQGIKVAVQGVATVKIGSDEESIRAAAERFLEREDQIDSIVKNVLEGSLRSIVGRLTIEEIIRDRAAFASAVAEEAEHSLTNQGLVLDTFQLQDIIAEGSYLQDLGRPEAARVLKDAAIAEARARQAAEQERLLAEEAIAEANRNLALKQAGIQAEIDAAKAKSAAAGPLAQAERDQAIIAEQRKVAEQNAELKQRQLDTEVRKPADAARYKVEQEAEGARNAAVFAADAQRQATIAAAQAAAEQSRLTGEGERARRAALAAATELEGQAEGASILARGQAEAEAMKRKADAFAAYGEAAILDLLVRVLPEVVEAAAAPMSAIDKMTVISTDGATAVTKAVAANVAQGLQLGTDLTGIDLVALLARLGGAAANGDGDGRRAVPAQLESEK